MDNMGTIGSVARAVIGYPAGMIDLSKVASLLEEAPLSIEDIAALIGIKPSSLATMRQIYPELPTPAPGQRDVYNDTIILAPGVDRESVDGRKWASYTWRRYMEDRRR